MITFRCPCGKTLKVKEERAGAKVKCPECDKVLRVPDIHGNKEKSGPAPPALKTRPKPADHEGPAEAERIPYRSRRDDGDEDRTFARQQRSGNRWNKKTVAIIAGGAGLLVLVAVLLLVVSTSASGSVAGKYVLVTEPNLHVELMGDGTFVTNYLQKLPKGKYRIDGNRINLYSELESDEGKIVGKYIVFHNKTFCKPEHLSAAVAEIAKGEGGTEEAGEERLCKNLKQVALAMHSFHNSHKRFPSPAEPLLSWRVAILEFIGDTPLYKQFKMDEPWDGPTNIKLLEKMPKAFQPVGSQKTKSGHTFLQLVTGPGTAYPTAKSTAQIPRSFLDGTSNTILIVETAEAVPWTKPADFSIDVSNLNQGFVPKLGHFSPNGFYAVLADGNVAFINSNGFAMPTVRERLLRQAFNPGDGEGVPAWGDALLLKASH